MTCLVKKEKIGIIGVQQDFGASKRGVDMGPSAIRIAGLRSILKHLGYVVVDFGNLHCHDPEEHLLLDTDLEVERVRFISHIVQTCLELKNIVSEMVENGYFPLVLGGDHSISIGTLAGLKTLHGGDTGIIWVDAHGDFNTPETTTTGNIHGMPFAVITGRGDQRLTSIGPSPTVKEKNAVLIAARDVDPGEALLLKESSITVFTIKEIDELGMSTVARKAIDIATRGVDHLHVSFDIDALDPSVAPGTGTPVLGGLTYREAHLLLEMIDESGKLSSFEMVEINPTLDVRNRTAEIAVGLIASALGKKILS